MRTRISTLLLALSLAAASRAADKYPLDVAHSHVGFSVKHLLVSTTKGRFTAFDGVIMLDEKDPAKSSVKVTIKAASVNTDNEKRDDHLRNADFFDVTKFPEITFASKKVAKTAAGWEATGPLTIKGVTKEVTIPFVLTGPVKDPWGNTRLGAEGGLTINRKDFGVAMANPGDSGIGDDVKIELAVEAVKEEKKK